MLLFKPSPIPSDAYRPDRPASDLIGTQVRHALEVESHLPRVLRSGMTINLETLTEGQAAAFLEHITRLSHPAGVAKAPAPVPGRKKAARRPTRRRAKPTRAARAKTPKPRRPKTPRRAARSRR